MGRAVRDWLGRSRLRAGPATRAVDRALARRRVRSAICALMLVGAAVVLPFLARPPGLELQDVPAREIGWIEPAMGSELRRPIAGDPRWTAGDPPTGPRPVQLFHRFALDGRPQTPLAIRFPAVGGAFEVYVNGAPIFDDAVEGPPHLALSGMRPAFLELDPHFFHARMNRVDVVVTGAPNRALAGGIALGPLPNRPATLAPPAGLAAGSGALSWLLLGAGLLALAAGPASDRVRAHTLAGLILLALAAKSLAAASPVVGLLGDFWIVLDRTALASGLMAAGAWLGGKRTFLRRRYRPVCLVVFAIMAAACFAAFVSAEWVWRLSAAGLVLSLAALAFAAASRLGPARKASPLRLAIIVVALSAGVLAVLGGLGELPSRGTLTVERSLVIAAAAAASLAAFEAGYRLSLAAVVAAREGVNLSALVRRQRQEIEETSRALQAETRRRTLAEERQRLVRDMHDGVGGQLVSLLIRVRSGRLSQDQIETELRTGLQDLRLIVDSMDSAGSSLEDALRQFRDRAKSQIEAAGMVLYWQQRRPLDIEAAEPRAILNIFRWLQEALTNALRHSKAGAITIKVDRSRSRLRIAISDDGTGLPDDRIAAPGGRGLANMKARAAELGGAFRIEAVRPTGTRLILDLDPEGFAREAGAAQS